LRTPFASTFGGVAAREGGPEADDRIALFLDVDGTLLDLAERPQDVMVPAGLVESVAGARDRIGGALALVSGRPIADLDRLFAPLRLSAAGVHGAELRLDPDSEPALAPGIAPLPSALRTAVNDVLSDFPGTFVEDKRFSLAVHYRQAPDVGGPLRARLADLVEPFRKTGIAMLDAHCAFELKSSRFDKGKAVAAFLSTPPFRDRTPIFIGDDDTDEPGFAAVAARGGCAYSVGRPRPGVVATFANPSEVRGCLAAFAHRYALA
jgi:trehalose 6-phosphate phosphatase